MDKTDVLARVCTLSKWTGEPERCRRCNRQLTGRSRKYCTKRCVRLWAQNHWYRKARVACRQRFRVKCGCPNVRSHIACAKCGTCEGQLKEMALWLECNHIKPKNGDDAVYSCVHHQENLEMLCLPCHKGVTKQQWLDGELTHVRKSTRRAPRPDTRGCRS